MEIFPSCAKQGVTTDCLMRQNKKILRKNKKFKKRKERYYKKKEIQIACLVRKSNGIIGLI